MSSVLNDHSYCIISESDGTSLNNSLSTVEKNINSFDEHLFSSTSTPEQPPPAKKNVRLSHSLHYFSECQTKY